MTDFERILAETENQDFIVVECDNGIELQTDHGIVTLRPDHTWEFTWMGED